jgi:hypothetical protein
MICLDDLYIDIKRRKNLIKIYPEQNEDTDMNQSFSVDSSLFSKENTDMKLFVDKELYYGIYEGKTEEHGDKYDSSSKNILTLEERINNLPEDLKKKIYTDYFGLIYIFNKFINERLNMIESVRLSYCKIINIIPFIINNETITNYLLENNNEFKLTYNDHMNGKKKFKLMSWSSSFALSWLYYLYH